MSGEPPAISVVIPLFDKAATIRRALDSVLAQTVAPAEVVVVNDGSTDTGPDVVRAVGDPRIRLIDQRNAGVAAARNRGIAAATSGLIALLDADDEWEPDFLETILELRRAFPGCGAYATSYWFRSPGARRQAIVRGLPEGFARGVITDYFSVAARSDPPLWSSAVAVTAEAIASVGGFPRGIYAGEDLLTWARLAARHDIAYCASPKAHFWQPLRLSDRPGRVPQQPDAVAAGLSRLEGEGPPDRTRGLAAYVAHWHRMRAVIFVQLGGGRAARAELRRAIGCAPAPSLFLLYLLTGLPGPLAAKALAGLRGVKRALLP